MNDNHPQSDNRDSTTPDSVIEQWMHDYLYGNITPTNFTALEDALLASPTLRTRFRSLATLEEGLADLAALAPVGLEPRLAAAVVNPSADTDDQSDAQPMSVTNSSTRHWGQQLQTASFWVPWIVAAASIALYFVNPRAPEPVLNTEEIRPVAGRILEPEAPVAVLLDQANAIFSDHSSYPHTKLERASDDRQSSDADAPLGKLNASQEMTVGRYNLVQGKVHLRFSSGAEVVMQAPAQFDVVDPLRMMFFHGRLRAIVPEKARGFTIQAPDFNFEDLGTEFGIVVDSHERTSQLHVFEGHVDVKHNEQVVCSVYDGQAVRCRDGIAEDMKSASVDQFPTPGVTGYERWLRRNSALPLDRTVIGHFPFIAGDKNVLTNWAMSSVGTEAEENIRQVSDGLISSARWVTGRWPGKQALLFERLSDFVEMQIDGDYEELTYALWAKIDSRNYSHIAVLNSNGWSPGDLHLQIRRTGTMWLSAYDAKCRADGQAVPTGQWVHLVATISLKDMQAKTYINGRLQCVDEVPENSLIRPGDSRLGNWNPGQNSSHPERTFHGRVDELTIWSRALSAEEIAAHYEEGRPSLFSK